MKTSKAASRFGLNPTQFRKFAKQYGVKSVKRNDWSEGDIKRLADTVTQTALRERGWTRSLVNKFADPPDKTAVNFRYRGGPPIKLYRLVRIEAFESSPAFIDALQKIQPRIKASKEAAEVQRQETLNWAKNVEIKLPVLSEEELLKRAVENYNDLHFDHFKSADENDDPEFLNRISVNYLRHCCTDYETLLRDKLGKVGSEDAYTTIKTRVLDKIGSVYPQLDDECWEQSKKV